VRNHPLLQAPLFLLSFSILGLAGCGVKDDGAGPDINIEGLDFSMLAQVLQGELSGAGLAMMLPSGGPGCLTVSSLADADVDGVPDDAEFVFSGSECMFTFDDGYGTTAGRARVVDPGGSFGFTETLSALAYTIHVDASGPDPAETRVRTLNGQRTVGGSPGQATLTQNVQVTYTVTNKPSASASETWQASFSPAPGASVAFGLSVRLPDGGTTITGPMNWTQSGNTVTLALTTTTPIWFDPACESPFPSAGEVHAQVVSGGPAGYVRIAWTSCGGETEVDFVES
jgi:hypothetical protein